jgi:hypothetical protein
MNENMPIIIASSFEAEADVEGKAFITRNVKIYGAEEISISIQTLALCDQEEHEVKVMLNDEVVGGGKFTGCSTFRTCPRQLTGSENELKIAMDGFEEETSIRGRIAVHDETPGGGPGGNGDEQREQLPKQFSGDSDDEGTAQIEARFGLAGVSIRRITIQLTEPCDVEDYEVSVTLSVDARDDHEVITDEPASECVLVDSGDLGGIVGSDFVLSIQLTNFDPDTHIVGWATIDFAQP